MCLQLVPDHRELTECRADDLALQVRAAAQHEAEPGREDKEEGEDREESVVGDRGDQVAALVVGVLLTNRQHKAQPPPPLLEAIESLVGAVGTHRLWVPVVEAPIPQEAALVRRAAATRARASNEFGPSDRATRRGDVIPWTRPSFINDALLR